MAAEKTKIAIIDSSQENIQYFAQLIEHWGAEAIIVKDVENAMLRLNILKPEAVFMSTDHNLDYSNIAQLLESRKYIHFFYGMEDPETPISNSQYFRGYWGPVLELDILKLKSILLGKPASEDEKNFHSEMIINDKIGIVEVDGYLKWEHAHKLHHELLHLFNQGKVLGVLFIIHKISSPHHELQYTFKHLFDFSSPLKLEHDYMKIIVMDEDILEIIHRRTPYGDLEKVDSYPEALMKMKGLIKDKRRMGISVGLLQAKSTFIENIYDYNGNLLKKKGEHFTSDEISELPLRGVDKIYYARDLSAMGVMLKTENLQKEAEEMVLKQFNDGEVFRIESKKEKLVLIMDDDNISLRLMKKVVERMGHKCRTASDGAEGLKIALLSNPDLIIMDLMMPNLNGVEFFKQYRRRNQGKFSPILAVSAISRKDVITPLLEMGVKDYMLKPIELKNLEEKIVKNIR